MYSRVRSIPLRLLYVDTPMVDTRDLKSRRLYTATLRCPTASRGVLTTKNNNLWVRFRRRLHAPFALAHGLPRRVLSLPASISLYSPGLVTAGPERARCCPVRSLSAPPSPPCSDISPFPDAARGDFGG